MNRLARKAIHPLLTEMILDRGSPAKAGAAALDALLSQNASQRIILDRRLLPNHQQVKASFLEAGGVTYVGIAFYAAVSSVPGECWVQGYLFDAEGRLLDAIDASVDSREGSLVAMFDLENRMLKIVTFQSGSAYRVAHGGVVRVVSGTCAFRVREGRFALEAGAK